MESFLTTFLSSGVGVKMRRAICVKPSLPIYLSCTSTEWYTYDPFFQSCNNFPSFASWDAFRSWRGHKLWHFYCATWAAAAALRGIHLREQAFRKPIWDLAGYWGCCGKTEKKSFVTIKHIGWGTLTPLFAKSSNKRVYVFLRQKYLGLLSRQFQNPRICPRFPCFWEQKWHLYGFP